MKGRLILSVAFVGVLLQPSISMCSQKPGWGDWFWSAFTPAQKERIQKAAPTVVGAALGSYVVGDIGYDSVASQYMSVVEPFGVTNPYIAYATGAIATIGVFAWCGLIIGETLRMSADIQSRVVDVRTNYEKYQARLAAVEKTKNALRFVIANPLIYPTRSSRINVLLKKDEFLQYINDQDNILQDACNQLISEINAVTYTAEQFEEDKQIDSYIMTLRAQIFAEPTLEAQIVALEEMLKAKENKLQSMIQIRGYSSLYYRLKNQLEVEKQLTPEQRAARGDWWPAEGSQKKMSPEEWQQQSAAINVQKRAEAKAAAEAAWSKQMKEAELKRLVEEQGKTSTFVAPENQ